MKRIRLLLVLATMPTEAFSWLVTTIAGLPGRGQIWPDGTGGFQRTSQESIKLARREAKALLEAGDDM